MIKMSKWAVKPEKQTLRSISTEGLKFAIRLFHINKEHYKIQIPNLQIVDILFRTPRLKKQIPSKTFQQLITGPYQTILRYMGSSVHDSSLQPGARWQWAPSNCVTSSCPSLHYGCNISKFTKGVESMYDPWTTRTSIKKNGFVSKVSLS